jgi:phosphoribosylanthranilate isomerase
MTTFVLVMETRVKICCISSKHEAMLAIKQGADALGLVGAMPSGPGIISDALIASIAKVIPPPVASFLLTSEQSTKNIIAHVSRTGTNTVQIVDELTEGSYLEIKHALPLLKLVQVIHVRNRLSIEEAQHNARFVDALLLDSGTPLGKVKVLGGTGTTHNWQLSREIVEAVNIPVFLAGGLNALNVQEAIATVKPFGVDVCSGVRTDGKLDKLKLAAFINAVRTAA